MQKSHSSSLQSVEDVARIQSRKSNTANEEDPHEDPSISATSLVPHCCSATHSTEGNAPSCVRSVLAPACTHHWSWTAQHKSDGLVELKFSATRQFYQKILDKPSNQFWKSGTVNVPKPLLQTVAECSLRSLTLRHWKLRRFYRIL